MILIKKKLIIVASAIALSVSGLAVTSYAIIRAYAQLSGNKVTMSEGIELNINDGKPIINDSEIFYEPGGTYKKEFTVENLGTMDVWYRVYPTDVQGALKDYITVTVKQQDGVILYQGGMSDASYNKAIAASLSAGEKKTLYLELYFASGADNSAQAQSVSFDVTVNATQKQNNPDKDFGD